MRLLSSRVLDPDDKLSAAIEDDYLRSRFVFAGDPAHARKIYARIAKFRERF